MRTFRSVCLSTLAFFLLTSPLLVRAQSAMQLVTVTPCRLLDTRQTGDPIQGGTAQTLNLPQLAQAAGCANLSSATAYSLNVTVVPHNGYLGYLIVWPAGESKPMVSTMNSLDGRIKANAAIVAAGTDGAISVYASNTTDIVLDIDAYFEPATASTLTFYSLPPCRVIDTRTGDGGPLQAFVERYFTILGSSCIPPGVIPLAYSFNFTVVPEPAGEPLGYLTVWPAGEPKPHVSTLNNLTATIVANAAIVAAPAGSDGQIIAYPDASTNLVIDINGYFASPFSASDPLALYTVNPCRVLDTRQGSGAFSGEFTVNVEGSPCQVTGAAQSYVLNATVVPQGVLGYLTLWANGQPRPLTSTLNALDGVVASNMAIVSTTNGSIDAFASGTTNLVLDISSYMAPLAPLTVPAQSLPGGTTGVSYPQTQLTASGGEPPYGWNLTTGSLPLPPGLTLSATGVISGTPTEGGTFPFTVQVTDAFNHMATANLSITITAGGLVITTTDLPAGTQNVAYNATLGAAGGDPPYTWSLASGHLPAGLSLNAGSGQITGTPTTTGVSSFAVEVTDSQRNTAQANLQIVINAATTNSSLTGNYAFSFNGFNHGKPVFMAGGFVADGNGNITLGVLDFNSGSGSPEAGYSFTGTYNVTANGLGTMQLNVTTLGVMNFHLSVSNGGNGALIQDNQDPNTRGSGVFFVQTPSEFTVPPPGGYAIGTFGADVNLNRYAKAGAFQVGPSGSVPSGTEDLNDDGTLASRNYSGQFDPPSPQTGRGQASLSFPNGVTNNYAYYVVSSGQYIILVTDPLVSFDPLPLGSILSQASRSFTNRSQQGVGVYEVEGVAPNGGNPVPDAVLGFFTANGNGTATAINDQNSGGTITQHQVSQGTYSVASNGRVTLSGFTGTPPILYLVNTNQAFVVGQDSSVASGILEPQTAVPPYTNLSILGNYLGATTTPVQSAIVDAVSFLFADGNGNINGIQNFSGPSGTGTLDLSATYEVDSTGRAVMTGAPAGILYVVSAKKIVLLPTGNAPALSSFNLGLTN